MSAKRKGAEEMPGGSTADRSREHPMEADFAGTPLSSQQLESGSVLMVEDEFKVEYAWDCGVAIGAYLEGLRSGTLLASTSRGDNRIMVPPRTFDELTWESVSELRELPGTGRVNTFSLCYVNWDASRRKKPLIPAVIELDGASEGMGILHLLGEVEADDVEIGMKVKAVWKPADERQGAITDILYFAPLKPSGREAKSSRSKKKRKKKNKEEKQKGTEKEKKKKQGKENKKQGKENKKQGKKKQRDG